MVIHGVTYWGGGMLLRAVNEELISLAPRPGNKASSSGDQIPVVTIVFILLGWTFAWALKITCERSVNLLELCL